MSAVVIYTPPPAVVQAINTALSQLPNAMDTPDARVMLYAIGWQESLFKHRRQIINRGGKLVAEGPAKSLWQGELGGGMCTGILKHKATKHYVHALCAQHGVAPNPRAIWDAIEHNDVLAASLARLLLFSDPKPLPKRNEAGAEEAGWAYYLRTWRPGAWTRGNAKQRADLRAKWHKHWESAIKVVQS